MSAYEIMKSVSLRVLKVSKRLTDEPTREQRIDWAYGSAVIENSKVTREMVEQAADRVRA